LKYLAEYENNFVKLSK